MTKDVNWQPAASRDLDREQPPHLRISSAGKCVRAQTYAAMHTPESNPPGQADGNRMALGHMAEVLILKEMERNGWETRHTVLSEQGQLELELEIPGTEETISGHPDGICRHIEFTNNLWVPLECKSMSEHRALDVEKDGVAAVYPAYVAQISLYGRKLYEMGLVSHLERGIFGMMDREGRFLPPERITWKREDVDRTLEMLARIVGWARAGEPPDRPYPQSSSECRYCNYHSECWGTELEPEEKTTPQAGATSQRPEVIEAARTWMELKPQVDRARDMLQAACNSAGGVDVTVEGVTGGYFQPRSERVYDTEALERAVPADILKKCLTDRREKPLAFWVRKARS